MVGGDEKEGRERKYGGNASAQGGANDSECGGKCRSLAQNFKAHSMVERSADLGKCRRRCEVAGSLCSEKGKNGQKHWQCDDVVQNVEEKHWKNEELRSAEEALPRPKECLLEEV